MSVRLQNLFSATRGAASSRHSVWTAIGIAGISLFAMNVHAEETFPQLTINYTDLDLSKQADAKTLYARLRTAARSVCRGLEGKELRHIRQQRACHAQALADAVASVDHANVTALYRSDGNIRVAQRGADSQRRS